VRVAAIVGRSGSGKTTLIERLIRAARERGLTVSTIKHTHHHDIELDTPGKDSHRHRVAGASEVIVASDSGWARLAASPVPASLQILLGQLRPVDLVLVEGFKQLEWLRRVEVFRGAGAPLAQEDPGIAAVAVPAEIALPAGRAARLPLDDTAAILDFILSA
jgi:molybdopterin-guanine dinucleotide biosynthesis adapter protein